MGDETFSRYHGSVVPDVEGTIQRPEGTWLYYRANGVDRDATPLLVVHGGPGYSHHYLLSLVDLAAERPVYFYDQSGCGESEALPAGTEVTIEHYVDEIRCVRKQLGLERTFLLGHSWGGMITPAHAAQHQDGLAGVILSNAAVSEPRWREDAVRLLAQLPAEVQAVIADPDLASDSAERAAALQAYADHTFYRGGSWPADILETLNRVNQDLFWQLWGDDDFGARPGSPAEGYDGTRYLPSIRVPSLVVAGEFDGCSPRSAAAYAALLPNSTLEVLEGVSHSPQYECRQRYVSLVRDWMRAVEAGW